MSWTDGPTWVTGHEVSPDDLNTYITDNLAVMKLFMNDNIAVLDSSASNVVNTTPYAQVGSVALTLTSIANPTRDNAILIFCNLVLVSSAINCDMRLWNNTTGAVPNVLGYTRSYSATNIITLFGIDRPAAGANTYHLQAQVASSSVNINNVKMFAMEVAR